MILFDYQWAHFPKAIIDTETKNTSFLRLAALYRDMNIKSNAIIRKIILI